MRTFLRHFAAPVFAVLVLGGVVLTSSWHLTPSDVGDYHQRVQRQVEDVPYAIGDWIAHDVPVPTQATEMLKPNALLSRQYLNTRTGERVSILLVHTLDARDLIGHYPPECYPASGWEITGRQAIDLPVETADGRTVEVARYRFAMREPIRTRRLEVLNLMVLPTGRYSIGMAGLSGVSGDYRVRHFGGAALQFVFGQPLPETRQAEVFSTFFRAMEPALRTILEGVERSEATPETASAGPTS